MRSDHHRRKRQVILQLTMPTGPSPGKAFSALGGEELVEGGGAQVSGVLGNETPRFAARGEW